MLSGFHVQAVYYFSAFATWRTGDYIKHREYVRRLKSAGVTVVMSHFKKKPAHCHKCGAKWWTHEEKETDVRMALQILKDAEDGNFDTAEVYAKLWKAVNFLAKQCQI